MKIQRFEDLEIWKDSRALCLLVKEITHQELFARDYKFRDQIRSSSGSIMDNIAEGFERDGRKEFIQFLSVSKGSCGELRSQFHRASDYEYISKKQSEELQEKVIALSKKISGLIQYLKTSEIKGTKFK